MLPAGRLIQGWGVKYWMPSVMKKRMRRKESCHPVAETLWASWASGLHACCSSHLKRERERGRKSYMQQATRLQHTDKQRTWQCLPLSKLALSTSYTLTYIHAHFAGEIARCCEHNTPGMSPLIHKWHPITCFELNVFLFVVVPNAQHVFFGWILQRNITYTTFQECGYRKAFESLYWIKIE